MLSPLTKTLVLLAVSVAVVLLCLNGCQKSDTMTIPRTTFDRMLGHDAPVTDTNLAAKIDALLLSHRQHISISDTNFTTVWNACQQLAGKLQTLELRLAALEPKAGQYGVLPSNGPPVIAPNLSAPTIPPAP